jgi:hypothetical protein
MIVQRRSIISGKVNTMNIDCTEEQLIRHKMGELVQDVFPNLSVEEREFLISGVTPEEWDNTFEDSKL